MESAAHFHMSPLVLTKMPLVEETLESGGLLFSLIVEYSLQIEKSYGVLYYPQHYLMFALTLFSLALKIVYWTSYCPCLKHIFDGPKTKIFRGLLDFIICVMVLIYLGLGVGLFVVLWNASNILKDFFIVVLCTIGLARISYFIRICYFATHLPHPDNLTMVHVVRGIFSCLTAVTLFIRDGFRRLYNIRPRTELVGTLEETELTQLAESEGSYDSSGEMRLILPRCPSGCECETCVLTEEYRQRLIKRLGRDPFVPIGVPCPGSMPTSKSEAGSSGVQRRERPSAASSSQSSKEEIFGLSPDSLNVEGGDLRKRPPSEDMSSKLQASEEEKSLLKPEEKKNLKSSSRPSSHHSQD